MKELYSKDSGELAGSADDVALQQELHGAVQMADVMIHHLPSTARVTSEATCSLKEQQI